MVSHYNTILNSIIALEDEMRATHWLNPILPPKMHAPQLQLLEGFADHHPELFCKKLCVTPEVFDAILDQISDHPIFHSNPQSPQLPIAIQLGIFLNHAGHYGNAISPEDVAQWAGVSAGSVVNCTNQVMAAILD